MVRPPTRQAQRISDPLQFSLRFYEPDEVALDTLQWALARHPIPAPSIEWRRYRTTAGMAHFDRWSISLSLVVLQDEEQIRSTVLHEYAHLLAVFRHGCRGKGHGPEWRRAMLDLGEEPEVKHKYACVRNQRRQVVLYRCALCGTMMPRHRRLPRRRKYLHVGCGGTVVFLGIERTTDS